MTFKEQRDAMDDLDYVVAELAGGHFVEKRLTNEPVYNFAGLKEYCKKKGVTTDDLTREEFDMFTIDDD